VSAPESDWKASRSLRAKASLIGAVGYPTIRLLGQSWRFVVEGHEHLDRVKAQGQFPVMAFWHGRILPSIYFFRDRDIVVITSDNFDGEWTAKIIHRFGYTTARGSTSRNAARAALRAKRRMEEGHAVGITVDGPRGPALVVQPGALWLANMDAAIACIGPQSGAIRVQTTLPGLRDSGRLFTVDPGQHLVYAMGRRGVVAISAPPACWR